MLQDLKENLKLFITSPVLLACLSSWFGAQFIKTLIFLLSRKIHSVGELVEAMLWRTGGMPSSHSAIVTSLSTTIAFRNGLNSDLFMISLVFFLVVIRDAFGVRRSSGIQAKKINELGKNLKENNLLKEFNPIKEVDGHTPMQVMLGCVLGFIVGLAFSLLK